MNARTKARGLAAAAAALAVVVALRAVVFDIYVVPSGSMSPTVAPGECVLGRRLHGGAPSPGEVVTFPDPGVPQVALVKRVVAVGGETVDYDGGILYVDGAPREFVTDHGGSYPLSGGCVAYPYTVPDGCVWVMGDNREFSLDSRRFGAVPVSSVATEVVLVYWPPTAARPI